MYNSWPTDSDVVTFLSSIGVWNVTLAPTVSGAIDAAVNKFEMLTGRIPFLTETASSISYYDPPGAVSKSTNYSWRGGGKVLELDSGFTEITSITIAVTADNDGQELDLNRQVRFSPINYAAKNLPIEEIDFAFAPWGTMSSIKIIGKRGYSTTIPSDVYHAIIKFAAAEMVPIIAAYQTGGVQEMSEADVKVKFGGSSSGFYGSGYLSDQANAWRTEFMNVVNRYTMIRLGL